MNELLGLTQPNTSVDSISAPAPLSPAPLGRDPVGPRWPRIISVLWSAPVVTLDDRAWLDITTADLPDGAVLTVSLLRHGRAVPAQTVLASATARIVSDRASLAFVPRVLRAQLPPRARIIARVRHPDVTEARSGPLLIRSDPSSDTVS